MDAKKKRQGIISLEQARKRFHEYYNRRSTTDLGRFRAKLFDMMHQKKPRFTLKPGQPGSEKYMLEEGPRTFDMEGVDTFPEGEQFQLEHQGIQKTYKSKGATFYKSDADDPRDSLEDAGQGKQKSRHIYGPRQKSKTLYSKYFKDRYRDRKQLDESRSASLKNKNLVDIYWDRWKSDEQFRHRNPRKNKKEIYRTDPTLPYEYEGVIYRLAKDGAIYDKGEPGIPPKIIGNMNEERFLDMRNYLAEQGLAWPSADLDGNYEFNLPMERRDKYKYRDSSTGSETGEESGEEGAEESEEESEISSETGVESGEEGEEESEEESEIGSEEDVMRETHMPNNKEQKIYINTQDGSVYDSENNPLLQANGEAVTVATLMEEFEITQEQLYSGYSEGDSDSEGATSVRSRGSSPSSSGSSPSSSGSSPSSRGPPPSSRGPPPSSRGSPPSSRGPPPSSRGSSTSSESSESSKLPPAEAVEAASMSPTEEVEAAPRSPAKSVEAASMSPTEAVEAAASAQADLQDTLKHDPSLKQPEPLSPNLETPASAQEDLLAELDMTSDSEQSEEESASAAESRPALESPPAVESASAAESRPALESPPAVESASAVDKSLLDERQIAAVKDGLFDTPDFLDGVDIESLLRDLKK